MKVSMLLRCSLRKSYKLHGSINMIFGNLVPANNDKYRFLIFHFFISYVIFSMSPILYGTNSQAQVWPLHFEYVTRMHGLVLSILNLAFVNSFLRNKHLSFPSTNIVLRIAKKLCCLEDCWIGDAAFVNRLDP